MPNPPHLPPFQQNSPSQDFVPHPCTPLFTTRIRSALQLKMMEILHKLREFRPYLPDSLFDASVAEAGDRTGLSAADRTTTALTSVSASPHFKGSSPALHPDDGVLTDLSQIHSSPSGLRPRYAADVRTIDTTSLAGSPKSIPDLSERARPVADPSPPLGPVRYSSRKHRFFTRLEGEVDPGGLPLCADSGSPTVQPACLPALTSGQHRLPTEVVLSPSVKKDEGLVRRSVRLWALLAHGAMCTGHLLPFVLCWCWTFTAGGRVCAGGGGRCVCAPHFASQRLRARSRGAIDCHPPAFASAARHLAAT